LTWGEGALDEISIVSRLWVVLTTAFNQMGLCAGHEASRQPEQQFLRVIP